MTINETDYLSKLEHESKPLLDFEDLNPLIDFINDKKIVMIGESTHGTAEFYHWRNIITQTLISQYGFNFVAIEGDWPSSQYVNNFVKNKSQEDVSQALGHFDRWPTWMWANTEVLDFVQWLRKYNSDHNSSIGFHGLDVYSLFDSMDQVIKILKKDDLESSLKAESYFTCLNAFSRDEMTYARSLFKTPEGCKEEILKVLEDVLSGKLGSKITGTEESLDLIQNAKILRHAEDYYRAMIFGEQNSWNIRDQHMFDTLESLLHHYGSGARGIVWAHNSHIGDYRATEMVASGEISLGGLAREILGDQHVALIGMGTNTGAVLASDAWDGPAEIKIIPAGKAFSVESSYHQLSKKMNSPKLFSIFSQSSKTGILAASLPHRAIGVVYDPDSDFRRNYVQSSLSHRYDAFIYLDVTNPIVPLGSHFNHLKFPETYPYGTRL